MRSMRQLVRTASAACIAALAGACASGGSPSATTHELAGTSWRLVEFQSSDDDIGIVRPANPDRYTMELQPDGRVAMQLNCNRGTGTWSASATDDESGSFTFGVLGVTRALCEPPSMDEQIARDTEFIRSYVHRDGRLYLALMADGGIYVWEPMP